MATNLRNIKANALFSSVPSMTVTGNSTIDNVNLTGNIIPDVSNTYSLGTAQLNFKDIYVGPGSLYVAGKKVLEEVSGTITFTTDLNQNLKITTSGSGDIQFDPIGTGVIAIKGPLQLEAGTNIISSDGNAVHFANPIATDSLTTHSANTDLTITANGTGTVKVNDDVSISGNLTVTGTTTYINTETVQIYDNIIDLNSNFTTGSPTENAGVRVLRGDEASVVIRWNESTDKWQYTLDGTNYVDIVGTTSIGATALGNAATANFFIGSGNNLSNIQGANVSGAVSYATTANAVAGANVSGTVANATYAVTAGTAYSVSAANISGTVNLANFATTANAVAGANVSGAVSFATTANSVAVANVSGIGNIATINKDGNVSNILYGNGVFAAAPAGGGGSYGDSNVATFLASYGSNTISTTGNANVGNLNVTTAVVASRLTSNVATGTAPLTVTSTTRVANLNVAYANVTDYVGTGTAQNGNFNITLQSGTSGNIQPLGNSAFIANATSGTLFSTLFTGTLTTNAQPNITSTGTLTSLTSGTHTISANANITMSGTLSQISGANLVSGTYLTGTLTTGDQPNITSTGSLTGLTVSNATGIVNFTTTANVTLGAVANLHISGGTNGQVLTTDGSGTLSWATSSGGGGGSSTSITMIAVTDETSNITVSSSRMSFRAPIAMTLTGIPRASLATASSSGLVTCDIKLNGTSILHATNKLSIDANELTSVTAETATSLVTTSIPDDGLITIDITSAGTGAKGLKITFYS